MTAQLATTVPGYRLEPPPDLSRRETREHLSPAAIEGFFAIADKWRLTSNEAASLLGGIPRSTLYKMRATPTTLNQDQLMRISYVVGIYKAIVVLLPSQFADRWITTPNHDYLFQGERPLDFMLREGIPGMEKVRRLLDHAQEGQ